MIKDAIPLMLKGAAMGAANVIPGVSGGTVAFVTGIYDRLINAIKSFDIEALKLLLKGQFGEFTKKVDFFFLFWLGLGVIISVVSIAKLLKLLFENQRELVFAFFFGLILASVYFVGKQVKKWGAGPIISLLIGTAIAAAIAFMPPAKENDSFVYLMICGVVAMASMIIPGLSGSFVLILLGNYYLIMIDGIVKLTALDFSALKIFVPVGIGAIIGLVALSHLLSWVFKKYHDTAVALLTGFVAGSLLIIWPWKNEITQEFQKGDEVKIKTVGYEGWNLPEMGTTTLLAVGLMIIGIVAVWMMEKFGAIDNDKA